MTVYEYIKTNGYDYDVYDDVFDACITCCDCFDLEEDDDDNYLRFYSELMKLANVVEIKKDWIVADWSEMILHNKPILEEYMKKNWRRQYEDEDDFVYEWIREFHLWGAGYASENAYRDFVENYMSRMTKTEREN